ncbi:MAG TPA: LysM peptidoglycan-binding domain-containing M23 family metallopeptidase [Ktedonobacterales bacterium]
MPHEDSGSWYASADASGDGNEPSVPLGAAGAVDDPALEFFPRERARTTATPLDLSDQRLAQLAALGDGDIPDEWTDAELTTVWNDEPGEAVADDEDSEEGAVSAAPVTARIESLHDLAAKAPFAAPITARVEAIPVSLARVSSPPAPTALEAELVTPPTVIPGAKRLKRPPKHPFIARRQRPLTIGLMAFTIIGVLVVAGVVIASPLGEVLNASGGNPLQPYAGAASVAGGVRFSWYTARWGDTPETVAQAFHVAIGGFYELNRLQAGDELLIGRQYMIPLDPAYGETYQPPSMLNVAAHYGDVRYGPNWWNSIAGNSPQGGVCAPNGGANELGYQLQAPNWGSRWVRGFIVYGTWVYHTGVDLAAPQGNVIHAAQAGQVIWAAYDATNGLGWSVKIDHCNHVSTVYGHMMRVLVHVGDFVDVGSPVGLEGSTGNSTGPHLHFMVEWNNLWVNPMLFYPSQAKIINP